MIFSQALRSWPDLGPVVITVAFICFLVAGFASAVMASIGIFLPVYLFTILPAPWFQSI
jgi:chromate transporter